MWSVEYPIAVPTSMTTGSSTRQSTASRRPVSQWTIGMESRSGELLHLAHHLGALRAQVPQIALDRLVEDAHDARQGTLVDMAGR